MWVRRAPGRDSEALVNPFMHVGTYPTRHLATLRESELLPAFSGPLPGCTRASGAATGQDSGAVHILSDLRPPMFLLNSRDLLVTATCPSTLKGRGAGTPSPEVTGPICRIPWPGIAPRRLRLLTQGTSVSSRYGRRPQHTYASLFTGPGTRANRHYGRPFLPSPGSRHYGTPRASAVRWGDGPTGPIPRRQEA